MTITYFIKFTAEYQIGITMLSGLTIKAIKMKAAIIIIMVK